MLTRLSSSASASFTVFGFCIECLTSASTRMMRASMAFVVLDLSIDEFLAVFGEGCFAVNLPIVLQVGYVSSRQSSVPPSHVLDRALIQYAAEA